MTPPLEHNPAVEKVLRSLFWKMFFRGRITSRKRGEEGKLPKFGMWGSLFMYMFVGAVPLIAVGKSDILTFSALLHGMTLFMIVFHMIATAGTSLFNKEEAEILLHRPVTSRQLLRAKVVVLCGVSALIALALNIPGMVAGVFIQDAHWWFPLVHAASSLCMIIFSAGCLVVVYQVSLRTFGRERLDNMMATLQTVLTLVLVAGSQAYRLLEKVDLQQIKQSWWLMVMPPTWFAAWNGALASRTAEPWLWVPAGVGLLATFLVAWLGFHQLAATYNQGLMMLNETGGSSGETRGSARWLHRILNSPPVRWWVHHPVEKSGFILAGAYMFRDRETKLRLFPGLGQVVAMPLVFLFLGKTGTGESQGIGVALSGIYLGWLPLLAMQTLAYSENWAASEMFTFTPEGRWQHLYHGCRKAVLILLAVPVVGVLLALIITFKGAGWHLLLLLPNLLLLPIWSLLPGTLSRWVPLSQPFDSKAHSRSGCMTMVLVLAVSGLISAAAWLSMRYGFLHWFLLLEAAMVGAVYAYLLGVIRRRGETPA